ncbi:MAG: hypothetical protein ACRENG_23260, partial [bacterium]
INHGTTKRYWLLALAAVIMGPYFIASAFSDKSASSPRAVVVIKDLTSSTPGEQDSLNNAFISTLLSQSSSGDEVYVTGITDASFSKPLVILHGTLPDDRHPLKPKLLAAQQSISSEWKSKSRSSTRPYKASDVIGAVYHASLLLRGKSSEKWMIILSDMRNSTKELDIENVPEIDREKSLGQLGAKGLIPNLTSVNVAVLSVHTTGKAISPIYYQSLENFWQGFFEKAHAEVVTYQADASWLPFDRMKSKIN